MTEEIKIKKQFHEKQLEVLNASERFLAAIAGVQSGKTIVGCAWLAKQVVDHPGENHLIVAPTYKVLEQSTLTKFFAEFPFFARFYRQQVGVIELPNGTNIFVRSAEEPYKLEGMTLKSCWADEAGQMKVDFWTVIQARLAVKRGRLLITTTPYNMGWLYTDFYKPAIAGQPDFKVIAWSSEQNPFFPKEEYERVKASMDPVTFAMRYKGVFQKRSGLVYPGFRDDMIVSDMPRFADVIGGIDWGWTAPASIIVVGIDADQRYWVIDEFYETQRTTKEIIHIAKQLQAKYHVNVFYADSAEPDRIQECRNDRLYVREANKDIKNGIDTVRQAINEERFRVKRGCVHILDELENYHYPEQGETGYDKDLPAKGVDNPDHALDALRYAIYTHNPEPIWMRDKTRRKKEYQFT